MNTTIPWYQSAIIRQQIVAFLIAGLGLLGIATDIDIEGTVAAILAGIGALIPIYTIITRVFKPSPNITQTAVTKETQLEQKGTIPQQGGFARPLMLALLLAVAIPAVLSVHGCATNPDGSRDLSPEGRQILETSTRIAVRHYVAGSPRGR